MDLFSGFAIRGLGLDIESSYVLMGSRMVNGIDRLGCWELELGAVDDANGNRNGNKKSRKQGPFLCAPEFETLDVQLDINLVSCGRLDILQLIGILSRSFEYNL